MATYRAPGVYIEEVPGARSISGVSTDVATFVGITERGKQNTPTLVTSWNEYQDKFGGFMWNRYIPMAVYDFFAEGGSQCYVVSTGMDSGFAASKVSIPEAGFTTTATGTLKFQAKSKGVWANTIRVGITTEPKGEAEVDNPVSFSVQVLQYAEEPGDHTNMSLSQIMTSRYVISNKIRPAASSLYADSYYSNSISAKAAVLEEFTGFTFDDLLGDEKNPSNLMQRINAASLFLKATTTSFGSLNANDSIAADAMKLPKRYIYSMAGGTGESKDLAWMTGLDTLDPILDFSTIALPDCVDQTTYSATTSSGSSFEDSWIWTGVTATDSAGAKGSTRELLGKCNEWQRVFAVTDPPYGLSVSEMKGYKTGSGKNVGQPLNSTYGAIYYPWLEASNPVNGKLIWVPPSGQVLGRYSATDQSIGPWKAPAGVEDGKLRTARGITFELTQTQRGILNPEGIDAIVPVLSYGICVYGARTVSMDPEWRYVPVRRLAIYIEQSLYFSLQWVVFEPNSPSLWGRVTRDVTAFMTNLWRQGALFGTSAAEAFFVTCDASNNPPATRDEGYLYIDIGFAPVKPAEFVVIRLSQITLST